MATAIFIRNRNDNTVTIMNQPGASYDADLWDQIKARLGLNDQELADRLNNTPT